MYINPTLTLIRMVDIDSAVCSPIRNWEAGELSNNHGLLEMRHVLLLCIAKFPCKSKYMARDLSLNGALLLLRPFWARKTSFGG